MKYFIGNNFQKIHMGSMVVGKFGIVVQIFTALVAVSIKWDFDPQKYIYIGIPICVFVLWAIGQVFEIMGWREEFMRAQLKGVLETLKDEK